MTDQEIPRLLESIQCLVCESCEQFKRITNSTVTLFTCGKCRAFLTTCAGRAVAHCAAEHPEVTFLNADHLARHFDAVFIVHAFTVNAHSAYFQLRRIPPPQQQQ